MVAAHNTLHRIYNHFLYHDRFHKHTHRQCQRFFSTIIALGLHFHIVMVRATHRIVSPKLGIHYFLYATVFFIVGIGLLPLHFGIFVEHDDFRHHLSKRCDHIKRNGYLSHHCMDSIVHCHRSLFGTARATL